MTEIKKEDKIKKSEFRDEKGRFLKGVKLSEEEKLKRISPRIREIKESEIVSMYTKDGLNINEIAKRLNVSPNFIFTKLKKNNINTSLKRNIMSKESLIKRSESLKEAYRTGRRIHHFKGKHFSEEHKNKISLGNKGKKINEKVKERLSNTWKNKFKNGYIHPHLNKHKSEETKKKIAISNSLWEHPIGEKASRWIDGRSYLPYSKEFNKKFKELIRIRDGFRCLKCGMIEEDHLRLFGAREPIHHINYDKKLTTKENCCVLCIRCNSEVNINREHWIKFFQSLLSERYNYKYGEKNGGNCKFIKCLQFLSPLFHFMKFLLHTF